jgi:hypothetical protein
MFISTVVLAMTRHLAADVATQGVPFVSQPYDPAQLAGINSYAPKQADLARVMQEALNSHDLKNAKVTVASWEPRILVVDDFMTAGEADHMVSVIGGALRAEHRPIMAMACHWCMRHI